MNEAPITIEAMVAQLGGSQNVDPNPAPAATDQNPAEPAAQPTGQTANESTPQAQVEPVGDPAPAINDPAPAPTQPDPQPQVQQPAPQKPSANEAFIHMRQENKKLQDTIKGVAELLGITDTTDPAKLTEALNLKMLEKQSQAQNVPVELLQRLNALESVNQQYTAMQKQIVIEQGFKDLRTAHNLDDKAVTAFINELIQNDMNPLEKDVDLDKEYVYRHHDELVQAAVAKAVAEEQQRAALAANSSNPGSTQSSSGQLGDPQKVNSVRDLETYFNNRINQSL